MRHQSAIFVILAACGGGKDNPVVVDSQPIDQAPPIDQPPPIDEPPPPDLTCAGNAAPTTADATIAMSGSTFDFDIQAMAAVAVPDASVHAFKRPNPQVGNATSGADGTWTLSIDNPSAMPIDGFVDATKTTYRPVRVYPPSPLTTTVSNVPMLMLTAAEFQQVITFSGAIFGTTVTQDAANGTVGVIITDCLNTPVAGTPTLTNENNVAVGQMVDGSALQPGLFLFFDVPPGVVHVGATLDTTTFRTHDIDVVAGTTSTTSVKPGF